jgi:hypothetical protein
VPVIASDLQHFSVALARGVIGRTELSEFADWEGEWFEGAQCILDADPLLSEAVALQGKLGSAPIADVAKSARTLCARSASSFCRAYGGWYYSPLQAMTLDALRRAASSVSGTDVAVAAVVQAASICAASPGHTAQPFKTDTGAAPFVVEAWRKDARDVTRRAAQRIADRCALVLGEASADDAERVAGTLKENDLAFLDPPYSAVHYSRFYHVLESIARNHVNDVSGAGRYPPPEDRPQSAFSVVTQSDAALHRLMTVIAERGASAVVTFPAGVASNGLSGHRVREMSGDLFQIDEEKVSSRFSTLGGDRRHRSARQDAEELILTLRPR